MSIKYRKIIAARCTLLFITCFAPGLILAQDNALQIPSEVRQFVEKGSTAIGLESADLDGDGTKDYVLVTEKAKVSPAVDEDAGDERSLLILVRGADGKLKPAGNNEKVVYCRSCGGVFGDPFAGVEVRRGSFTVNNYGGSTWRWSESYQFNYSRRDRTWQLVLATDESFNAFEPNKIKRKIHTPKTFGKINLADFDPEHVK